MFVIETAYFNLDQIYNSGLAPRWIKLKELHYVIMHGDRSLKIQQQRDRFDLNKCRLIMNCSEEDFYNIWYHYLDLETDYYMLNMETRKLGNKFKIVANRGNGVHVLKQDLFEVYVLCKLAQNVGWTKAKELMNRIAATYGTEHKQSMREAGRVTWYEWPSPEIMLEKLKGEKESSGKVKSFLKPLCNAIVNDGFDIMKSDDELFRLIGLHDFGAFPVTGIGDILARNFNCEADDFADSYLSEFKGKGLVYAYILHHVMNPPRGIKEAKSNGISR